MTLQPDWLGPQVIVIAEAGVNHNGSVRLGLDLVDAAARAGADAVKFQTFRADALASSRAEKAGYQKQLATDESQLEMLRALELSPAAHLQLAERARLRGIRFLSSPFDSDSADFLAKSIDVPAIKIASGEITNAPLLLHVARLGKPVIVSTGMSTLEEVGTALGVLAFGYTKPASAPAAARQFDKALKSAAGKRALASRVTLMHCTTEYPAPFDDVNLRAMATLRDTFGLTVGYSDHTLGASVALAAVSLGARVIEKHLTLDRALPGPDHRASLEPAEFATMVNGIREVERALGSAEKQPAPCEVGNRSVARRSLVASRPVRKGERFTTANLAVKRPGTGISPLRYWEWLGRVAERDYAADEAIE